MTEPQRKSLTETYKKNREDKSQKKLKWETYGYFCDFVREYYPIKRQRQKFK